MALMTVLSEYRNVKRIKITIKSDVLISRRAEYASIKQKLEAKSLDPFLLNFFKLCMKFCLLKLYIEKEHRPVIFLDYVGKYIKSISKNHTQFYVFDSIFL